jgi:hypothetical protein
VESGTQSQDLMLNPATGTFDGTLTLPPGMQILVARAFSNDTLVGQSPPTPVDIQAGTVTVVMIRILDLTPEAPPLYGPIFDALSHPTSAEAGSPVTFMISVVAPAGDPVSYSWTSDCSDSTFSVQAATTNWSKATKGTCSIRVVATSNGQSVMQSFVIVVFAAAPRTAPPG